MKIIEAANADDPQALENTFFEQNTDSGIQQHYKSLNSTVSKIKAHPDGIMTQSDMTVLMNNPQITLLAKTTGHSRSQIIDWQGKALLGKDWVGLPADFVATDAEMQQAEGLAKRFMGEQKMRTTESLKFIPIQKAVQSGKAPGYPLNSYSMPLHKARNPAEAQRVGTTGHDTGYREQGTGHAIVMPTEQGAYQAKTLLDENPGLWKEITRSQQTAEYNAGVPGASTTSNHRADIGAGALDLAGPIADALAANPTGEAANWIWERHNGNHWHIEPKRGN